MRVVDESVVSSERGDEERIYAPFKSGTVQSGTKVSSYYIWSVRLYNFTAKDTRSFRCKSRAVDLFQSRFWLRNFWWNADIQLIDACWDPNPELLRYLLAPVPPVVYIDWVQITSFCPLSAR